MTEKFNLKEKKRLQKYLEKHIKNSVVRGNILVLIALKEKIFIKKLKEAWAHLPSAYHNEILDKLSGGL